MTKDRHGLTNVSLLPPALCKYSGDYPFPHFSAFIFHMVLCRTFWGDENVAAVNMTLCVSTPNLGCLGLE